MNDRNTRNNRNARPASDAPSVPDAPSVSAPPASSPTPGAPSVPDAPASSVSAPSVPASSSVSAPPASSPTPGAPSVPDGIGHVLSVPRYVAHAERWTRNAPARVVVGAESGRVVVSREQTPTERGEAHDKDDAPIPAPSDPTRGDTSMVAPASMVAGGRVSVSIDAGTTDAGALARFVVALLSGAGIDAVSAEADARASVSAQRRTLKALRAEYEPGILSALEMVGNPARASMVGAFWGGASPLALEMLKAGIADALKAGIVFDVSPSIRAALARASKIDGAHRAGVDSFSALLPASPTPSVPASSPPAPGVVSGAGVVPAPSVPDAPASSSVPA